MKKPWSISTTVRSPSRIRDFLKVLKELEGERFNSNNQIKYQILLIKHRLYKPTQLTRSQKDYFEDIERDMPYSVAKEIFDAQDYEDPAMRGRNSVAPLNKMGLCIAKNAADSVKITNFGNYFLSDDPDLGKVFFFHFLKWQLPNPDSRTFSASDGFSIIPFIGTLHLINKVNELWMNLGHQPTGINKEEFSLFVPTLIDHQDISSQAERVINFRIQLNNHRTTSSKNSFRTRYKRNFASEFLETVNSRAIASLIKNLKDYGDNAIRYFRLTRYIYIRGGGFYIDLEPRRQIEINKILEEYDAAPLHFSNAEQYLAYISDLDLPVLPWETASELKRIAINIERDVNTFGPEIISKATAISQLQFINPDTLSKPQLNNYIDNLRDYRRLLQDTKIQLDSQNIEIINQYIDQLQTIHQSNLKKSVLLEKLATLALNALNDALQIKPNYPVGDDNEPTFTAPANKADIECYYEAFNAVCEVTMLTNRSQWYHEGQPVMRHVRTFERLHSDKQTYCLFVAPRLHQDTVETFWMAIKYGYQGQKQRIVPLTISQFIELLQLLVNIKQSGQSFYHSELLNLYDKILEITDRVNSSDLWIREIPGAIHTWKESLLSQN